MAEVEMKIKGLFVMIVAVLSSEIYCGRDTFTVCFKNCEEQ